MVSASVEKLFNSLRPHLTSVESFSASDGDLSDWYVHQAHSHTTASKRSPSLICSL